MNDTTPQPDITDLGDAKVIPRRFTNTYTPAEVDRENTARRGEEAILATERTTNKEAVMTFYTNPHHAAYMKYVRTGKRPD